MVQNQSRDERTQEDYPTYAKIHSRCRSSCIISFLPCFYTFSGTYLTEKKFSICLLVSPYYSYLNHWSQVYSKFVCLYFMTSVSCQIQVFVVLFNNVFTGHYKFIICWLSVLLCSLGGSEESCFSLLDVSVRSEFSSGDVVR